MNAFNIQLQSICYKRLDKSFMLSVGKTNTQVHGNQSILICHAFAHSVVCMTCTSSFYLCSAQQQLLSIWTSVYI